jgi:hypothetical protein
MNKIPVGSTIERSYSFGFTNILSIFGIAWFPYVVLVAILAGLVFLLAPDLPRMVMHGDFQMDQLPSVFRIAGLFSLLSYIVMCMVTVGIQRKALGKHPGPVFFYFSLGAPVWRLLISWFLAWLVIALIIAITAGAAAAIWFAAGNYVPQFATLIRALVVIAACLWVIYMMVRFTFFLPSVVVAEETIGLGRAWELAGGNFWRIFVVTIAVIFPVAIGFGIVSSALFGPMFIMPQIHDHPDVHEIMRTLFSQLRVVGPFMIVFQIVERIVFLGLGNGLVANAYLAVTGSSGSGSSES